MSFGAVKAGKAFVEIALAGQEKIAKEIGKVEKKLRHLSKVKVDKAIIRVGLKGQAKVNQGLAAISARVKALSAGMSRLATIGLAAGLAGGLIAMTKSVSAASDMQETMNKFNVVFAESADEVKAWSDTTAKAFGRSKKQLADFMSSSQDLLVPMGMNADSALDMSKGLSTLAMDLASFNNQADADVMTDLHAALTGSGEVMKKYGVIVSEAAVKQELLNRNVDPKNATEAQKAMARYNIILRGTTAAQGDVARSSDSFANQLKALQAWIDDLSVSIGGRVLPVLETWMSDLTAFIEIANDASGQTDQLGASTDQLTQNMENAISPVELFARAWYAVAGNLRMAQSGISFLIAKLMELVEVMAKTGTAKFVLGEELAAGTTDFAKAWKLDAMKDVDELQTYARKDFSLAFGDTLSKQLEEAKKRLQEQREAAVKPLKEYDKIDAFSRQLDSSSKDIKEAADKMIQQASPESLEKTSTQAYVQFMENQKQEQMRALQRINSSANLTNETLKKIDRSLMSSPVVRTIA